MNGAHIYCFPPRSFKHVYKLPSLMNHHFSSSGHVPVKFSIPFLISFPLPEQLLFLPIYLMCSHSTIHFSDGLFSRMIYLTTLHQFYFPFAGT